MLITHINDLVVETPFEVTYFVPAKTYAEFNDRAREIRLKKGMRDYLGYTHGFWRYTYLSGKLTVRLSHVIDLPDSDLPSMMKVLPPLRCHELGHVKINRLVMEKAIRALRRRLPLEVNEIERTLGEFWGKTTQFHAQYDKKTRHGCGYDAMCRSIAADVC